MDFITRDGIRSQNIAAKKEITQHFLLPQQPEGEMLIRNTGKTPDKQFFTEKQFKYYSDAPKGEMMSMQDVRAFVQQTVLDISVAQAEYPTVFQEIYEEIRNSSFSDSIKVRELIGLQSAFCIVKDGESVPLSDFEFGKSETVDFKTYAAGYSVSRDWVDYNKFWKVAQANKAIGIAHNAILDHMHLKPIITGTYSGKSLTNHVTTGSTNLENVWLSLRKGIQDALKRKAVSGYKLRPTIALCNSATAMDVEAAVNGFMQKGSQLGQLGMIKKVLAYDGWEGEVGGVVYNFDAPADNEVYLIQPKRTFKALVKTDLTELTQQGNVLTLSALDVAKFFRRAVVADTEHSVHKVTIA